MTKMTVEEFGDALLDTQDLDPIYVMLNGARAAGELSDDQLYRWLLAYWCFYHAGGASFLSEFEHPYYWRAMDAAARNENPILGMPVIRFPRSAERRHFRGQKCVDAVAFMKENFQTANLLIHSLCHTEHPTVFHLSLQTVLARVKKLPQFGPWIGFKVADMIETVLGLPVQFPVDDIVMYSEPRAALDILVEQRGGTPKQHFIQLLQRYGVRNAPPRFDRSCGPQEVETILCKWKSYLGGHYHVGKDTKEIRHGLDGWGTVAEALKQHLPA